MTASPSTDQQKSLDIVRHDAELAYRQFNRVVVAEEKPVERTNLPQPQRPLTSMRPELRHIWQEGDKIEIVGLKYGVDPEEILDLNLVEEHELKPGDELRIPSKYSGKKKRSIRYEPLPHETEMYANKPEGIKKYAFGNIDDPNNIQGTGHFPLGTPVKIVGIAYVPINETDTLAYYMDAHAFGDYQRTHKVNWNIGFAWSELTEGKYMSPVEEVPAKTILDEPDQPLTMFDDTPEPQPVQPAMHEDAINPLTPDATPVKFLYERDITIHELHNRHQPILRRRLDPVWIIGTFMHRGTEYYQPGKTLGDVVRSGLLWAIPMDSVVPEDEVFDFSVKRRPMTRQERWYELLAKLAANYTKVIEKIKHKQ